MFESAITTTCPVIDEDASPLIQPSKLEVRRLDRHHENEIAQVLFSLSVQDRCRRFGHAVSDTHLLGHVTIALANSVIIGALVDGRVRGISEIYGCGRNEHAEAAFVVEHNWRRQGLGFALLRAAIQISAQAESCTLRIICSRDNWPMRSLGSKANGRFDILLDELSIDFNLDEVRQSNDIEELAMFPVI